MTAAHCVAGATSMKVYLGAHNVREVEDFRLEFDSNEYFEHPSWNQFLIRNDIGLVRLPQKIEFNDIIRPVCLPSYSDVNDNFAGLDVCISFAYLTFKKLMKFFFRRLPADGANLPIPQPAFPQSYVKSLPKPSPIWLAFLNCSKSPRITFAFLVLVEKAHAMEIPAVPYTKSWTMDA